jgi:hypothetical protein
MEPKEAVLDAYRRGASTRKEIALWSDVDADLVDLILDMLIRTGEISPTKLKTPCTSQGCRNCDLDSSCKPNQSGVNGPVSINLGSKPKR